MKKFLCILMALFMLMGVAACNTEEGNGEENNGEANGETNGETNGEPLARPSKSASTTSCRAALPPMDRAPLTASSWP